MGRNNVGDAELDYISGPNALDIQLNDTEPSAVDQLRKGRVDANMNDNPAADYSASQEPDTFESLSDEILLEAAPFGWGVRERSRELKDALRGAINNFLKCHGGFFPGAPGQMN